MLKKKLNFIITVLWLVEMFSDFFIIYMFFHTFGFLSSFTHSTFPWKKRKEKECKFKDFIFLCLWGCEIGHEMAFTVYINGLKKTCI